MSPLASASDAIILGFQCESQCKGPGPWRKKENIDIRFYDVIYNAINDVRLAMAGLLEPVLKENVIGHAEVREIFRVPKVGTIAGCHVMDGHVERNAKVRVVAGTMWLFLTDGFHP